MRAKQCNIIDGDIVWQCSTCREWKKESEFYKCSRSPNGLKAQCKICHRKTSIATRDPDNNRRINREYMRRTRKSNPDKFRERERIAYTAREKDTRTIARKKLNRAVRSGKITRPSSCSKCHREIKVTAHHPDYSKPLDVEWLCYECHGNK